MAICASWSTPDHGVPNELTNTGFKFGAATVDRVTTLPRGVACLRIETPKAALNFRITKTGVMHVYTDNGMEVLFGRSTPGATGTTT